MEQRDFERVGVGHEFIAVSPAMLEVRRHIEQLAAIDSAVLVAGESGTGKELTARLIHQLSTRASRELTKVNCAALFADLLETELFGFDAGSLAGVDESRPGKFESANKSTLFLDEISALPPSLQPRLLHVLQEGEFARVGATSTTQCDVRVIAATDSDLRPLVQNGTFRSDLYFRLNCFTIQIPPLRERKEDLPHLLNYFMGTWAGVYKKKRLPITQRILDACSGHSWPGNVRELENFVKRYLILEDENAALKQLELEANAEPWADSEAIHLSLGGKDICDLKSVVRDLKQDAEKAAIIQALERTRGNKQEAASLLHISLRALHYKVRAYGIESASLRSATCVDFPETAARTNSPADSTANRLSNAGKILTMARSVR